MAGIFGFYDLRKNSDPTALLKSMHKASDFGFNHPSNFKINKEKNAGLGFSLPYYDSSWPLQSKDGKYIFQKLGEIILQDGILLSKNNFELKFLMPFLQSTQSFLRSIEGNYIFVLYDVTKKEIILVNDPFGNFALYYFYNKDRIIFSCQMQGILKVLQNYEWNYKALNQYLGVGFPLNGSSFYKNIYKIEPATMIKFSAKGLKKIKYYKPVFEEKADYKKEFDIINNSISGIIETHVANNTDIAAALTGGFDSRVTWSIIHKKKLKQKVDAYTHGLKQSHDVNIAQKIAQKMDFNHIVQIFDQELINKLPFLWEKFTCLNEGINPVSGALTIPVWEFSKNYFNTIFDSHGGAIYRRQVWKLAESRIVNYKPFAEQFYDIVASPFMNFDFVYLHVRNKIKSDIIAGLQEFYDSCQPDSKTGDIFDIYYLYQASALKYSNAANVQLNYLNVIHPFLSLKAFNAVQKIPIKIRKKQLIYKYIVRKNCKQLEKFPLENIGFKIPYSGVNYLRYIPIAYESMLQILLQKTGLIFLAPLSLKKFVADHNQFFSANAKNIKEILLRKNDMFFDMVNRNMLEDYLNKKIQEKFFNYILLDNLISFKLYLDLFHN